MSIGKNLYWKYFHERPTSEAGLHFNAKTLTYIIKCKIMSFRNLIHDIQCFRMICNKRERDINMENGFFMISYKPSVKRKWIFFYFSATGGNIPFASIGQISIW